MNTRLFARAYAWALRFIQLQLFLTVFSLPILIAWGLPVSLLSPLGNLIFSPALTVFLFLSSLIFCCHLLCIPSAWLVYLLENVTRAWLTIMHNDSKSWLIGFTQPPRWFLILIALASLAVLMNTITNTPKRSIAVWSILFLILMAYSHLARWQAPLVASFPCNNGEVAIIQCDNKLTLLDPGYIGQRISAPSWVQYTLMPHLINSYGIPHIDTIITLRNNGMTLEALERLATTAGGITTIYLPRPDYPLNLSTQKKWDHLKTTAYYKGITLHYINDISGPISISNKKKIYAQIMHKNKNSITTEELASIDLQIDNENIPLYAARYTKKNNPSSDKTVFHARNSGKGGQ